MRNVVLALGALFWATAALACAQGHHHGQDEAATAASVAAYKDAMEKMHEGMDIDYTGDADADFVNGMIPHHQGAVDMARVVLKHGKDPELRRLAKGIIAAQEKEIRFMKKWQAAHPVQQH